MYRSLIDNLSSSAIHLKLIENVQQRFAFEVCCVFPGKSFWSFSYSERTTRRWRSTCAISSNI